VSGYRLDDWDSVPVMLGHRHNVSFLYSSSSVARVIIFIRLGKASHIPCMGDPVNTFRTVGEQMRLLPMFVVMALGNNLQYLLVELYIIYESYRGIYRCPAYDVPNSRTCFWAQFKLKRSNKHMSKSQLIQRYGHFKN
jgi:hypothetical protein